jgi:hypothetical protein
MTSIELLKQDLDAELKLGTKMVVNWDMYIEMHKQEILDAYSSGRFDYEDYTKGIKTRVKQSNEYYDKCYVSKGSDEHIGEANEMIGVPQQEISDEEIKKAAIGMGIASSIATAYFIEGAQWYRRKLKK